MQSGSPKQFASPQAVRQHGKKLSSQVQSMSSPPSDTSLSTVTIITKSASSKKLPSPSSEMPAGRKMTASSTPSSPTESLHTIAFVKEKEKDPKKQSQEIDMQLKKDAAQMKKDAVAVRKVILLGTGDSGKSTILRQLTIIHGPGFSQKERYKYRTSIFQLVKTNFIKLFQAIEETSLVMKDAIAHNLSVYLIAYSGQVGVCRSV
jgi:G-protein alpha subunit